MQAVRQLARGVPEALLVDGARMPALELWEGEPVHVQPLVEGDALSFSIAAASIVAKVHNSRLTPT